MSEHNPWESKPRPTPEQVQQLAQEALTDWINRASLPYTLVDARGRSFELRQQELFYIQQGLRLILTEGRDTLDAYLDKHLGGDI